MPLSREHIRSNIESIRESAQAVDKGLNGENTVEELRRAGNDLVDSGMLLQNFARIMRHNDIDAV